MTARNASLVVIAAAALSLLAFYLFVRRVSVISLTFAGTREVRQVLEQSMQDQKQLAQLDPANESEYRRRFQDRRELLNRIDILAMNRAAIARRYEWALLAVVSMIVMGGTTLYIAAVRRRERRLSVIRQSLEALGRGEVDVLIGDARHDAIGRIAGMIESTSREIGRDRRRLQYLDHLSAWQEAARRHAHEIRTPLTAARLEIERLVANVSERNPSMGDEVALAQTSINEELDRLADFTRQFTSFARLGEPRLELHDLWDVVEEFRRTFDQAWPSVRLVVERTECDDCHVRVDREMLRQVLVNLCNNSAMADATQITFRVREDRTRIFLDVADDGSGITPVVRARLFEPYTTTRAIGEGMGLGLAISKKIMLDHRGDLDLLDDHAARGATFRLTFPRVSGS